MPPTLTAVICNYNHGRYIGQALEAILSQSRPPDDFVIVDDGSTDDSVKIIGPYAARHVCIRFIRNERNLGAMASIERALGVAQGDYLYWGAADDYVLPGFFEKTLQMALRYPEAGVLFGCCVPINEVGAKMPRLEAACWKEAQFVTPQRFLAEWIDRCEPSLSLSGATIYRRACLLEMGGFQPTLRSWADTFVIRAIALKYGACYLPEDFMMWRLSPSSYSHATVSDPRRGLDMVSRAAWLMRSPRYRALFPAEHVARWKSAYRRSLIDDHLQGYHAKYTAARVTFAAGVQVGGAGQRLLGRFLGKASGLLHKAMARLLRETLTGYTGDVSCYEQSDRRFS